jgi:hypothetical protein
MSRAGNIIEWVLQVDEAGTPSAFTEDPGDQHDINKAKGYHYQGRYAGKDVEDGKDSRDLDGTKPSGYDVTNTYRKGENTGRVMDGTEKSRMDTALGKH